MTFKKLKTIILAVAFLLILPVTVSAADALYRFMHNDHDALVIGQVTKVSGDKITVKVVKSIISAKDLNAGAPKKQLSLKTVTISGVTGYAFYYNDKGNPVLAPKIGDCVLASLIKSKQTFKIAWGLYKVDKTDYKTLSVLYKADSRPYVKMCAAAVKAFVNSGGKLTKFSFNGDTGRVTSGGKVIYDAGKK